MRGYARLDPDRPFIRRQSILVLSAVDSDVKRVAPYPRQMAPSLTCVPRASGVRGSTGDTIHVSSGKRERVHPPHTSVRRMCVCVCVHVGFSACFHNRVSQHCYFALARLLLEAIIFCPTASVPDNHRHIARPISQPVCYVRRGDLLPRMVERTPPSLAFDRTTLRSVRVSCFQIHDRRTSLHSVQR